MPRRVTHRSALQRRIYIAESAGRRRDWEGVPEELVERFDAEMAVLILDSEALSSLAHPRQTQAGTNWYGPGCVRLLEGETRCAFSPPSWSSSTEVRAMTNLLIGCSPRGWFVRVVTTGALIARHAGHLLAHAGRRGGLAVDALVVATTIRLGGGLILTHDPADLKLLSARHPAVRIVTI